MRFIGSYSLRLTGLPKTRPCGQDHCPDACWLMGVLGKITEAGLTAQEGDVGSRALDRARGVLGDWVAIVRPMVPLGLTQVVFRYMNIFINEKNSISSCCVGVQRDFEVVLVALVSFFLF